MGLYDNYPYTNLHELNLDWLMKEMKKLRQDWENFVAGSSLSAIATTLAAGLPATASLTGSFSEGLVFSFGIPKGLQGEKGDTGDTGAQGAPGAGLQILDTYATLADLQAAHPVGLSGDAYLVGTTPNFELYIWSTSTSAWADAGSLTSPSPYTSTPEMDSALGSAGTVNRYSKGDHSHPQDTSKLDKRTNDGTYVDLYSVAGTVQNVVKLTDSPEAGASAMYDQIDGNLNTGTPNSDYQCATKKYVDDAEDVLQAQIDTNTIDINTLGTTKQATLVSGTNIKTIDNISLLGSGNVNSHYYGLDETNLLASQSSSCSYTATEDCFIIYILQIDNVYPEVKINGFTVIAQGSFPSYMILPLKKDDVFTAWWYGSAYNIMYRVHGVK